MSNAIEQAKSTLIQAINDAVIANNWGTKDFSIPQITLETPKDKSHGDYATNIAMQLTRLLKMPPRVIAEGIISKLDYHAAGINKAEVAGPGFINFFMALDFLSDVITQTLSSGEAYGKTNEGKGKRVQVEFVSANPTGSLHLGHARGAAVGDTLCNILEMAGYDVSREYYINDAGNQINNLAYSIEARYREALGLLATMPEDGYFGEDIKQFGRDLADLSGDQYIHQSEEERFRFFRQFGLEKELAKIKTDLAEFRVHFDEWFSETSLYEKDMILPTLNKLRGNGHIFEEEGATWFRSTTFGDDKDRVLVKGDGSYTYLTPDIAYHQNKLERGFEQLINIWGADHHGYIPRMKAAIEALGYGPDQLKVLVTQMVSLYQDGEKVKMSKRTGKAITLVDLMTEVGIDATRYFFAMRSLDSHLDFDMDLAVSKSNENPVFYVQYAHARICGLQRQAEEAGLVFSMDNLDQIKLDLLQAEGEIILLKKIGEFPQEVAHAANTLTPHKIVRYVYELAGLFHSYYNQERVVVEDKDVAYARLALIKSVQTVIQNGLRLIGVSAPERM